MSFKRTLDVIAQALEGREPSASWRVPPIERRIIARAAPRPAAPGPRFALIALRDLGDPHRVVRRRS